MITSEDLILSTILESLGNVPLTTKETIVLDVNLVYQQQNPNLSDYLTLL